MAMQKTVEEIFSILEKKKELLSSAESCTGGLLATVLTEVPGSSKFFEGGVTAYSNFAKQRLLGVDGTLLSTVGAVSQEVVVAMAQLVRAKLDAHYGIAITGVAGPGGGTKEKPVGTVWWAISDSGGTTSECLVLTGDRNSIRNQTVEIVLKELLNILKSKV